MVCQEKESSVQKLMIQPALTLRCTVPLMNIFTLTSFSHLATQLKSWQVKFEDHERFSFGGMEASM